MDERRFLPSIPYGLIVKEIVCHIVLKQIHEYMLEDWIEQYESGKKARSFVWIILIHIFLKIESKRH